MSALSQYRLVDQAGRKASYPGIAADFRATFATLRGLPCDIFLGAHGLYFDMLGKLPRVGREGDAVWIDPAGYRAAVEHGEKEFKAALARR